MCSVGQGDVFSFLPDVFSFLPNVFSFGPDVFTFEGNVSRFHPNVSTLAGQVFSFGWGALVGDGARTEGEIPFDRLRAGSRLRCAALGMTEAAGQVFSFGWGASPRFRRLRGGMTRGK